MACVDWRHLEAFHGRAHKLAVCGPWYEQVVWATSEDPMKREEFTEQELRQSGYLTERFTEQTWLNPAIQHLQRVGDSCTLIGSIIKYTFSPIVLLLFPLCDVPPAGLGNLSKGSERATVEPSQHSQQGMFCIPYQTASFCAGRLGRKQGECDGARL